MFQKVKPYMGEYTRYTKRAAVAVTAAVILSVVPYFFLYQIIAALTAGEKISTGFVMLRAVLSAVCLVGNAVLYGYGLDMSHYSAYNTLKNLRAALQGKLEQQPLGTIRELGNGRITLGGQDLTDMSITALNDQISFVSQEQFLFNTSLYDNILIGKPNATREEVLRAASLAQCDEFLQRLPNGIDSMAGEGGKMLSGGERQRISLARALLKDAPVIVLDEATAFIDPENEEKMNAAISEVIRGKTVLIIAHRLHTVVGADKIIVLNEGNVDAEGTHEELLKKSEVYRRLWAAAQQSVEWEVRA